MTRGRAHLLRDRRSGAGAAAVVVALILTVALVPWSSGASEPAQAQAVAAAKRSTAGCADTLVVGLDGNGQRRAHGHFFGPTVDRVVRRVVAKAEGHGHSVSVARVRLRTLPPTALLARHVSSRQSTLKAISKHGVRAWGKPVAAGVRSTLALLNAKIARCPERPVLLVGYAQGAAVVHRVLGRVAASGGLPHLIGGIVIADPDRLAHSVARPVLGSPPAPGRRGGIFPTFLKATSDVPAAQGSFGVWSVCQRADLVCHPSRASVHDSLKAARGDAEHRVVLKKVAAAAWRQLSLWPVPALRSQVVTTAVGQAVHVQLALAPAAPAGSVWSNVAGLPPGLTFSGAGLLEGTPTQPGTFVVSYQTLGTAPATTGHSGTVLVKVTAASVSLSAGGQATCLTQSDLTARCWGRNNFGQLGDGTILSRNVPTLVLGTGWVDISTSGSTTCGVKNDGTLWCWGLDNFGQAGVGTGAPIRAPRQVGTSHAWAKVSAAYSHTCGTMTDGTLWCWGQNLRGQLGIGTVDRLHAKPVRVGTGTGWESVTTGGWHTCALTIGGTAYCWGQNDFGELGDGTIITHPTPTPVAGNTSWLQLSAAWGQTCGVTQTGRMLCWGFNRQGQLGRGDTTNSALPVAVAGTQVWTQVATGDGSTCGVDSGGQMWCWGDNRYGQLGLPASTAVTPTPIPVTTLAGPVSLASAGWLHTCAVPTGVPFTCWGNNEVGQVGNGVVQTVGALSVRHQEAFPRLPSHRFLAHASPTQVVDRALGSRPAARHPVKRATLTPFSIVSMNVLGSNHTAPGADSPQFAPGRIRAEWASSILRDKNASLVGTQESQPDQIAALATATSQAYTFYPGTTLGYPGAPQSVMWRTAEWNLVWKSSISIPFTDGFRPQPVVELQQVSTGAQLYWINVHFFPRAAHQAQRDKAMKVLLPTIRKLQKDKLPILLTGDFNEIAPAFCKITAKTALRASNGGSNNGGHCILPPKARIDWIFGSLQPFTHTFADRSAQVARTTDHAVVSARFGTG